MFRTFSLVAAVSAALLGLLVGWSRESQRARSTGKGEGLAGGRTERCVTCHMRDSEDPGGPHARSALGCETCHLGNPLAFDKERAHEGLELEPGALETVAQTCGRDGCHPREASRVASSLMTRAAGIVSVDRFAFGEIPAPDGTQTMADVLAARHPTTTESHLRKLCAGCHLRTRRANRDDAIRGSGSGCAACHAPLRVPAGLPRRHPPVDSRVGDDRCFGCHSRSGRIALSYRGLAEIEPHQLKSAASPCPTPLALADGRPVCRVEPDVHQASGMACIDCHLHTELMGDGVARQHKEDQVEVTCEACHGPVRDGGEVPWKSVEDQVTREILRMRKFEQLADARVRLARRGTPVWNLRRGSSSSSSAGWVLVRKLDGKAVPVKRTPHDANHMRKGHERLSCSSCHAAWAPTCTTCHTAFDSSKTQWDFASERESKGAWVERSDGFSWASPLLGIFPSGKIVPAVPGMILDVDAKGAGDGRIARRLLAPLEPHTTGKRARTCESCHRPSAPPPDFDAGTRPEFRAPDAKEFHRVAVARIRPR